METAAGSCRVVHPLAPICDASSRVLILGTMPSPKSREIGFYYGHPQNRFWKVMAAIFDEPVPQTNAEREALVLAHRVALWDVLASCSIKGAADGSITDCVPNDIASLLNTAPIRAVFCTGAKAADLYRRLCEPSTGMPCTRLPSTSPANAAVSLPQLIEAYRQIVPLCEEGLRVRG
ncbi:DNA-deoxyinosine glycosylase [Adlercreutzia murintestinalis]|uniref:DNA-deoxyinosine glycosylase n=1 Tax=Adlercreutzia murintestinalis TaxID=2941325 RepID=UPI00204057C3|nr:DNA-deoxyinosine glycosylase [Adlercreutzia murintestinalis]